MSTSAPVGQTTNVYQSGGVTTGGTIVMMTPESLVALCAMQLRSFDKTMLDRMNEKKGNIDLQEKVAALTAELGTATIDQNNPGKRQSILDKIDQLLQQINGMKQSGSGDHSDLAASLQSVRDRVSGGLSNDELQAKKADFESKVGATNDAVKEWNATHGPAEQITRLPNGALATATAEFNAGDEFNQKIKPHMDAEANAYAALPPTISETDVAALSEDLGRATSSLNTRNDEILMELQSLVSQRSTSIQMTTNLTNSLLESSRTIASNIGK